MKVKSTFLFLIVLLAGLLTALACTTCYAQDSTRLIGELDLFDLIRSKKKKQEVRSAAPEKGKLMLVAVPALGSNPNMGSFIGVASTAAMYLGEPANTNISSMSASALFTTKDQVVTNLKGTIMTPGNRWEFLLDTRYLIYAEDTYGLGTDNLQPVKSSWNLGGINTSAVDGAQPMDFDHIRIHVTALKAEQLLDFFYVGIGYHLDYHYNIEDKLLNLSGESATITSHYAYNTYYGIPVDKYYTSGISLNVAIDSRDHVVSTYKGEFLQFAYRFNSDILGSTHNSQTIYVEAREFISMSAIIPRHLVALWGVAQLTTHGELPYLDLPAHGYDMRNRIGKGYVQGRFRGRDWVALEAEYRFPITRNGLLGAVLFGNATSTSRPRMTIAGETIERLGLFDYIRPAGGVGARINLNKSGRLNVTMDMAFGQQGSKGFYFSVGETF